MLYPQEGPTMVPISYPKDFIKLKLLPYENQHFYQAGRLQCPVGRSANEGGPEAPTDSFLADWLGELSVSL